MKYKPKIKKLLKSDNKIERKSLYKQAIDESKLNQSKSYDDLQDAADFDSMKDSSWSFNPDKVYYNGWSEEDNIILLRRDPATGKRIKEVYPFEWYFFITREDYDSLPKEKWDWLCRNHVNKIELDSRYPDKYVRIYVDNTIPKVNRKKVFDKVGDNDTGKNWSVEFYLGERPRSIRYPKDRDRWTKRHNTLKWCDRNEITPLEADLSPRQRFLTDYDINIMPKFHFGFVDIETDDTIGGFENKEENRILSIAWEGDKIETDPDDHGFVILEEESDEAEKKMLLEFKRKCLKKYDVIAAWNGTGFDFPVFMYRFHYHKIFVDWRYYLFADPLPVFKRHYVRAGADAVSFKLDSIGEKVLNMNKIDWRTTFKERNPDVLPKFINLYRYEKELLEEYNRHDCRILRKLEEFTGFVMIEQLFCRISNGFPNDFSISTKVDQLMLKKGYKEGHHFPTRYWKYSSDEQYEGAYVFPPKVGMYRNVGAFDFKSLYPSMVSAFNISPETIIKEEDRKNFKENEMCSIPLNIVGEKGGTTFRLDQHGFISQMFARTLERRAKYTDLQKKRLDEVGTTQDDLYLLYYRLAYSFKRLGLSFYGDMGNSQSRYYDTELAEAITLSGQFFIKLTAKYATECGMAPLYGDTDSVYIQLAPVEKEWDNEVDRIKELTETGEKFVEYCQKRYLKILIDQNCNMKWNKVILEFEDVFDQIFFITKKRYAGRMLSHKGGKTDHVEVKGLEVMRSDCSGMTRKLQQDVLDAILMHKMPGCEIEEKLIRPVYERCINGELTVDEVSISKGISKDPDKYDLKTIHVRIAQDIKDNGVEFYIGMKIEFIVISSKPKLAGVTRIEYETNQTISYDVEYYWDRVIYPSSQRILEVVFKDKDWTRFVIKMGNRRRTLVERYKKWFLHPKKLQKAIDQIVENKKELLGEIELSELRRSPKIKFLIE